MIAPPRSVSGCPLDRRRPRRCHPRHRHRAAADPLPLVEPSSGPAYFAASAPSSWTDLVAAPNRDTRPAPFSAHPRRHRAQALRPAPALHQAQVLLRPAQALRPQAATQAQEPRPHPPAAGSGHRPRPASRTLSNSPSIGPSEPLRLALRRRRARSRSRFRCRRCSLIGLRCISSRNDRRRPCRRLRASTRVPRRQVRIRPGVRNVPTTTPDCDQAGPGQPEPCRASFPESHGPLSFRCP